MIRRNRSFSLGRLLPLSCPALAEHVERFLDAALACLWHFGTFNGQYIPTFMAVRQAIEELLGLYIVLDGLG